MEITGKSISQYTEEQLSRVKATCLSVAQTLGDMIQENAVIVGGLVPVLLYQDVIPAWEFGAHAGTRDIDLTLDLVILERDRYENVAECLRRSGFAPDFNENGNITRQRWRAKNGAQVELLMPPVPPDTKGGRQQSLTQELAVFTMSGLDLALRTRLLVPLAGTDLEGRSVERFVPVCPAEVFIILKALAIAGRDKPKDAYDMHYVLLHDARGAQGVGEAVRQLLPHESVDAAMASLRRDYKEITGRGPRDVCSFLGQADNEALAGDALAFVLEFLRAAEACGNRLND
ncbi:MAG TPA: nucleotidyl transferase AbiEii/AbiGii toxin family protein [Candidatus Baltobacteraceae bacterium]|jgi:hypothetical protein|nr:nucleotidyl transferase AbiEii/AbiGii toxin family protein [Candidatus Baltobacteraceae bacterium]